MSSVVMKKIGQRKRRKVISGQLKSEPERNPRCYKTSMGRFLRRPEVEFFTGLPRSSIYDLMATGDFPKPVLIGTKAIAWLEVEIESWQNQCIARRDARERPSNKQSANETKDTA